MTTLRIETVDNRTQVSVDDNNISARITHIDVDIGVQSSSATLTCHMPSLDITPTSWGVAFGRHGDDLRGHLERLVSELKPLVQRGSSDELLLNGVTDLLRETHDGG